MAEESQPDSLPAPVPIKPDFARERAKLLWQGYHTTVAALESKVARKPLRPSPSSIRIGRLLEAGKGVQRYQDAVLGNKPQPIKPKVEKQHPRTYMKKKVGAERYRRYISSKRGDPYP